MSRRWTLLELELLSRLFLYARDGDISRVLGRSLKGVSRQRAIHGWQRPVGRGGQACMSTEAVAEAWRRVQAGRALTPALLCWPHHSTPTGTAGRHSHAPLNQGRGWLRGDLELLESLLGCCPLAEMARLLGRSRPAVLDVLKRQGWLNRHLQFTPRGLVFALAGEGRFVSLGAVKSWLSRGRVRVVRDGPHGRLRLVHRDDAEWLLSNYEYGVRFPEHPGAEE